MKKYLFAGALVIAAAAAFFLYSGKGGPTAPETDGGGVVVTTSLKGKPVLVGDIPCRFPLTEEPRTLNMLISGHDGKDQTDVFVWKKYEQMTGVSVNWTTVDIDNRSEFIYAALTNKRDVDLIMRCRVKSDVLSRYGKSGLILDLAKDGMLQKYAPNCWAFLQSHPEAFASVINPDGTVYALPQVNSGPELRVSRKIYINREWLKNVKMKPPTTTEELYLLLKAFKERDANGNGDPNDEIPFCSHDWESIQDVLMGAFGLGTRGAHNLFVDADEKTGRVRLIAASDGYRDFLEYSHRLFSEGLIDNHMFTMTKKQWYVNAENDKIGVFANTNLAGLPADRTKNWIGIEEALEGPNGDKLWTAVRANFHSTGDAIIPATCKDPALVLRWLDYFWTDEGTLFYHMGVEGETFEAKEDGTYDYLPKIYEEIESGNKPFDDVVARYTPYPGGGNPTVEIAPYFMGGEMGEVPARTARALFKYGPREYWPSFTFTPAETDALDTLQTDIAKYCSAMLIQFVTGTKPLSEWNEYKTQVNKLGMSRVLDIYQAAADRYARLKTTLRD